MIVVSSVVMSVYKRVTTHSCCASTCLYTVGTTYSSVGLCCYSSHYVTTMLIIYVYYYVTTMLVKKIKKKCIFLLKQVSLKCF